MGAPKWPRLSLASLYEWAEEHGAPMHDQQQLAVWLGVTTRSLQRWRIEGDGTVPFKSADEVAIHLGRHPAEIWGDEYFNVVAPKVKRPMMDRAKAPPQFAGVSEKDFMATVKDLATLNRWCYYHTHNSRRSDSGFPDVVLVRPPRVIFAELKSMHGRMSKQQTAWEEELTRCPGVEYFIWRPDDWEEIVKVLARDSS